MMEALTTALFLAVANNRVVEYVFKPVFVKLNLDTFWLLYIALVTGGVLGWVSGINLFDAYLSSGYALLAGRILTAIVVGGGANLINDLWPSRA